MKVAFLINPTIKSYKRISADIQNEFPSAENKFFISESKGHLIELTRKALEDNFKILVAVGGDGTVNEVLNGILQHSTLDGKVNFSLLEHVKLGVLPSGSGNDFVRNFKGDFTIEKLKENILNNVFQTIDCGRCTLKNNEGAEIERYFLNIADCGIGSATMQFKNRIPLYFGADLRYIFSILGSFLSFRKKALNIEAEDFSWQGKNLAMVIANGKYFGNGLGIAPDASVSDGILNITVAGEVSLLDFFKKILKLKKARRILHPKIFYFEGRNLSISSVEKEESLIDIDGEICGSTPAQFEILPNCIRFIA